MTRQKTDTLTTADIYNLVDKKIGEVTISINRLTDSFNNLEAGRLSALEKQVANMQGRLMMIPTIISIAISIFFFAVEVVLKGGK